jgi:hypothetical protein
VRDRTDILLNDSVRGHRPPHAHRIASLAVRSQFTSRDIRVPTSRTGMIDAFITTAGRDIGLPCEPGVDGALQTVKTNRNKRDGILVKKGWLMFARCSRIAIRLEGLL